MTSACQVYIAASSAEVLRRLSGHGITWYCGKARAPPVQTHDCDLHQKTFSKQGMFPYVLRRCSRHKPQQKRAPRVVWLPKALDILAAGPQGAHAASRHSEPGRDRFPDRWPTCFSILPYLLLTSGLPSSSATGGRGTRQIWFSPQADSTCVACRRADANL